MWINRTDKGTVGDAGKGESFYPSKKIWKNLESEYASVFFLEEGYCDAKRLFQGFGNHGAGRSVYQAYVPLSGHQPFVEVIETARLWAGFIQLKKVIAEEFRRHDQILESEQL